MADMPKNEMISWAQILTLYRKYMLPIKIKLFDKNRVLVVIGFIYLGLKLQK